VLLRRMTNKFLNALMIAGISLCFLYTVYVVYIAGANWALARIQTAGAKGIVIAGSLSITEGEVIYVDESCTAIEYYYVWDGIDYTRVLHHVNADFPQNAKVAVVHSNTTLAGGGLVVGFYRKYMLICGMTGLILFILSIIFKLKRKGKETWQEERL